MPIIDLELPAEIIRRLKAHAEHAGCTTSIVAEKLLEVGLESTSKEEIANRAEARRAEHQARMEMVERIVLPMMTPGIWILEALVAQNILAKTDLKSPMIEKHIASLVRRGLIERTKNEQGHWTLRLAPSEETL